MLLAPLNNFAGARSQPAGDLPGGSRAVLRPRRKEEAYLRALAARAGALSGVCRKGGSEHGAETLSTEA